MTADLEIPAKDIAIVILAAGSSSRLGSPKQLVKYRGQTLISRAVESALGASLGPVIVVTSPELSDAISEQIAEVPIDIVLNPDRRSGMSSSIRAGLSHVLSEAPDLTAVILALCDQPEITTATFSRLADTFRREGKPIVASEYCGTLGVPALFDRSMFDELFELTGDRGAKSLIKCRMHEVAKIPVPEAAFDIDSAADLDSLK